MAKKKRPLKEIIAAPTSNSGKKEAFLAAYSEIGVVTHAADAAQVDRKMHWHWMQSDPNYPEKFALAKEEACDVLEREARRRAVDGWDEPVYQGGVLVGHKRRYSDVMLAMMLNGNMPEKYARHKVEHSGPGGGALKTENTLIQVYLPDNGRQNLPAPPQIMDDRTTNTNGTNGNR